jgi:hypothetical protein
MSRSNVIRILFFTAADDDQFGVGRFRCHNRRFGDIVPLRPQPLDDRTIDVFISKNSHSHAAE